MYTLRDGKPVIYARGRDGKDRGGIIPQEPRGDVPESEDWILYPRAKNPD